MATKTLNVAFIHSFPNERDELKTKAPLVMRYCGAPGANKKFDIVLGEAPLTGFDDADGEALGWSFDFAHSYAHTPIMILALPSSLLTDKGKGYLIELEDYLKDDCGYTHTRMYRIKHHYFGTPIIGETLYLQAQHEPIEAPKAMNIRPAVVSDLFPSVITHAEVNPENITFLRGSGSVNGFVKSNNHQFPPLANWKSMRLMVEKRQGKTLTTTRLDGKDIRKLFGVAVEEDSDIYHLQRVTPNRVHEAFLQSFLPYEA